MFNPLCNRAAGEQSNKCNSITVIRFKNCNKGETEKDRFDMNSLTAPVTSDKKYALTHTDEFSSVQIVLFLISSFSSIVNQFDKQEVTLDQNISI